MIDGFIQQAGFPQAHQRRNGKLFVICITLEMIDRITQFLTEKADVIFDFRALWTMRIVKAIHTTAMYKVLIDPVKHDVRHLFVADQVITVVAIFIELVQVNVIEAGTAVQYTVINDETFEMQNTKRFTCVYGHSVNTNINPWVFLRHTAVPVSIGIGRCRTNSTALRAMPVNQYTNVKFRALAFSFIDST
ncbi:hypothetical protein D3C76_1072960 [compost metagenome]